MKKKLFVILLCGVMALGLAGCSNPVSDSKKELEDAKNDLAPIYLKKIAILLESDSKKEEAAKLYQQIKDEYPQSNEAYDIDKYLARVQG